MSNQFDPDIHSLNWKTRWTLRRNRILGSQRFQRWAAKTPIFRTIARRKAARQFDLIAGFVYTQIAYVFVESGLIHFLQESPRSDTEIAEFLNFGEHATDRILRAGAALGLAETPQAGLWTLGETGASLSANDGALAMVRHHALFYRDLADPFALLSQQGGVDSELSAFWTYAAKRSDDGQSDGQKNNRAAAAYSDLMGATQPMVWQQIIGRYPFARHCKMLDIGGGSGAFIEAVAKIAPQLELGLFDLPDVIPLAQQRFAGGSFADRITAVGGSFRSDDLPAGYDLVTLIRLLHDHDDDVVQTLLVKIHDSLPPAGHLLIVEPMAETPGAKGMGDAYFGLYLWAMGSGRPRSIHENGAMLKKAGFSKVKVISTPLPIIAQAIVATK